VNTCKKKALEKKRSQLDKYKNVVAVGTSATAAPQHRYRQPKFSVEPSENVVKKSLRIIVELTQIQSKLHAKI